jgi:hypothetical protein
MKMSILDEPVRLISSLASSPAYNVAERAYRNAAFVIASQSTMASQSILASLADRHRAIAAAMVPANALAGLEQSLLESFAPYHNLAVEAAGQFASARLQIDVTQLQSLLIGTLPAFLEELSPAPADTTSPRHDDQAADHGASALRESVVSYAPLVFWLAMLLWVIWIGGTLVRGDLGDGHRTDAMRDAMAGIALLIVLADKARGSLPPS